MADIVKKVDRLIPPLERTQLFDQNDAGKDDVIMVRESLGRPARSVVIEATAPVKVAFNVYHWVYPRRQTPVSGVEGSPRNVMDSLMYTDHLPNLARGVRMDRSDAVAGIWIDASETFEMDGSYPTSDIKLLEASGVFSILLT